MKESTELLEKIGEYWYKKAMDYYDLQICDIEKEKSIAWVMEHYNTSKSDLYFFTEYNKKFVSKIISSKVRKHATDKNIFSVLETSGKLDKKAFILLYTNVSERKVAESLNQNKSWVSRKKKILLNLLRM